MPLAAGTSLSHYRLVEPIGEGGMGVVWRANDSTLGRDVAIKVLPDLFVSDPERLARFEREARLLASLNHPHIASIFGLHSADGVRFLAMELVEGEDLAQRLQRGPIPIAEALPVALQIAQALEHAHERGVIHRDLKPANVKLTAEGKAKVLDFGLAKALEGEGTRPPSSSIMSQSPTITGAMTGVNVLLGTAAYMAPEQARGHVADRRADIWAFGVLVMEMLTGRRLFEGETISDTLASVLKTDPDWSTLPRETPPRLRALLRRCLDRNARQRLRDIGEARITLEELVAGKDPEPAAAAAPTTKRGTAQAITIGIAGLMLGILATLAVGLTFRTPPPEVPLRKFQLLNPPNSTAVPQVPMISPDGGTVAYLSGGGIWIQSLSDMSPRVLKADAQASLLFWSPDGKYLGYVSGTRILKISLNGGEHQAVCDIRGEMSGGAWAHWWEDGTIAFSRADSGGVLRVPAVGGDPSPWIAPDSTESDMHEPFVLPGGRGVLYAGHRHQGGTNNLVLWSRGRRRVLLEFGDQRVAQPVYDPAGYILFSRTPPTPGIWALPFSLSRLEATGQPFLVVPGGNYPTVSNEGTLSCITSTPQGTRQLAWLDRNGKELGTIGEPDAGSVYPALSADGGRVAWSIGPAGTRDIWIFDLARGTRSRVTFDRAGVDVPAWTPSGDRIVYRLLAPGSQAPMGFRVVSRKADGTGTVDTLAHGGNAAVTPDGRHVVYQSFENQGAIWNLSEIPLEGGTPRVVLRGNPRIIDGRVSPSGRFVAYCSNESGRWEAYLARYPGGEGRWQVSVAGGQSPHWNARGDRLFFVQGEDIMEVEVSGTEVPVLSTPKRLFTRPSSGAQPTFGLTPIFEVTGDGQRFLVVRAAGEQGPAPGVAVVQNWTAEFRNKK